MRKVLVLEDEENIRSFVVINLKRAGYETIEAGTGEEALALIKEDPGIKVALLDIMLPGIDGFEVCRRIRAMDSKIGIIMLTARTQEMDKVTGLMTGADDYVTKPFSPAELTARVDALFRRTGGEEESVSADEISQPPFLLNTRNRTLDLPAEHPQPDPGKKRPAGEADPGGVRHRQAVHGESGKGPLPGGDPGRGVGQGLLRRAENRGREHPPPAHQNRGQPHETDVCEYGVGLRLQVGQLRRLS